MYALICADGSVQIMIVKEGVTPEEALAKWHPDERAKVVSIAEIAEVPSDRTFRDAWQLSGQRVDVQMSKAREIHRDRLRKARAPLLAALDVEFMRAIEAGDKDVQKTVSAKKQTLRDVTVDPRIEAANTADELKAVWPDVLT